MMFEDGPLMALKWMYKRQVAIRSTIHDDTMMEKPRWTRTASSGVKVIQKPEVINKYTTLILEELIRLTNCLLTHHTSKWYK